MKEIFVDDVRVIVEGFDPSVLEIREYIKMAKQETDESIEEIILTMNNGCVDMDYRTADRPFERVRRITGGLNSV